jgi:hypothetical protein
MTAEHERVLNLKIAEIRSEEKQHLEKIKLLNDELADMVLDFDNYEDMYKFTYKHSKNLTEFYTTMYLLKPIFFKRKEKELM